MQPLRRGGRYKATDNNGTRAIKSKGHEPKYPGMAKKSSKAVLTEAAKERHRLMLTDATDLVIVFFLYGLF